jgi:DNA processing protein
MDRQQDELFLFWLVLQRLPGTAAATLHKLHEHFGSAAGIIEAETRSLSSLLGADALLEFNRYRDRGVRSKAGQQALKDFEWLQSRNVHLLTIEDACYPSQLREIHSAPSLLMVHGDKKLLGETQLAIIGSRRASPSGLEHAQQFAAELVECGFVITSGLAFGIDSSAHQGAISAGKALDRKTTIAVIATGLDLCYPSRHEKLMRDICEQGAIVSEFPLGTPPIKENFPRRNRIISGLSQGVLVVEAEEKSGSLITARYALEQNREVFAIPGSINNPGSRGCHQLIRQGAHLVENVDDILRELDHPLGQTVLFQATAPVSKPVPAHSHAANRRLEKQSQREPLDAEEQQLLLFMDDCAISADHLSRRAARPIEQVISLLLSMEIKGWVESTDDGYRRHS